MAGLNDKVRESIYEAGRIGYGAFREAMKKAGHPEAGKLAQWEDLDPIIQGAWSVGVMRGADPIIRRDLQDFLVGLAAGMKKLADNMNDPSFDVRAKGAY